MRLSYLFIFLTIVTISLTVLYLIGYEILDLIMAMITVDFLSLGAIIEHQRRFPSKNIKKLEERVNSIEKICNDIYHVLGSNPKFEEKLQKQKDDMSSLLDKIIQSSTKLDEKIDGFSPSAESKEDSAISISETVYLDEEE